jgi:hypothetical protein
VNWGLVPKERNGFVVLKRDREGQPLFASEKLPMRVRTLLGSDVTVVKVCLDIHYSVEQDKITIESVRLSRGGGTIGKGESINVSSEKTGEAWFASSICSEPQQAEVVSKDLAGSASR